LPWEKLYRSPKILKHKFFTVLTSKFRRSNHRIGAHTCTNWTVPYGTALLGWRCPRHFVPGCDRTVPPGHSQQALASDCLSSQLRLTQKPGLALDLCFFGIRRASPFDDRMLILHQAATLNYAQAVISMTVTASMD
jgi:hypothetical protein